MSLILYPPDQENFECNGIGILADVIDDEVYQELNGQYELTVKYPVDGIHFGEIAADCYILAKPDPVTEAQPFRIYRITKPMRGQVTIYARHSAYRLKQMVVAPFTAANAPGALQGLKDNAVNACPFTFWTDKGTEAGFSAGIPSDIWTLLGGAKGGILDVYGGEYEFDRYTVKLWNRRGMDRGVSIRYGKNLTSLQQDENVANVFTGIYPYWTNGEGELVTLPERYISGPGEYTEEKIKPVDLSGEFDTKPSVEALRARAVKYMEDNDVGKPDISWTVEFVQLEQTDEYRGTALLERVLLGDTVNVLFPKLGVDVSARAVAVRYKPSLGRYKSITLGRVKSNLAGTIAQQQQAINRIPSVTNLEAAVNRATSWLVNGKGYMIAVKDAEGNWKEICSLDTPDINQATKVWRWNNGGFGFSSTGYNGPYRLALTQDGEIVADFITTGTLDAALVNVVNLVADNITAGKLRSQDGLSWFNLDTGILGLMGEADAEGYASNLRLMSGCLWGDLYKDGENHGLAFSLAAAPYGALLRTWGDRSLYLGTGENPVHLRGSEIHIEGAPVYLGRKSLQWRTNPNDGFSYLVGVEVSE